MIEVVVMIKKAIFRGIIPFVIMTSLAIFIRLQGIDIFQVKSTFLVGIIATSIASASVIYEIEKIMSFMNEKYRTGSTMGGVLFYFLILSLF